MAKAKAKAPPVPAAASTTVSIPAATQCQRCPNAYAKPCTSDQEKDRCYSAFFAADPKRDMADFAKHLDLMGPQ